MSYLFKATRIFQHITTQLCSRARLHTIKLNSGFDIPLLGMGSWQAKPEDMKKATKVAIDVGYRHFDTAPNYNNEKVIGEVLHEWLKGGGKREELFVTSKLPVYGNRPDDVCKYLDRSLKNLQLEYVDLYLMHMPFSLCPDDKGEGPAKRGDDSVVLEHTDHFAVWKQMEGQVTRGVTKSIGISNFNVVQMERLFGGAVIPPAVIQVEMHVYLQQPEIRYLAEKLNVGIVASSPLGSPGTKKYLAEKYELEIDLPDPLNDPIVIEIAKCKNRTPAQILLIFLVQQCSAVIPKSIKPERIKENADIFNCRLNEEDMERLKLLERGAKGRVLNYMFWKGVDEHPEYPFRRDLKVIRDVMKKAKKI